MNKKCSKYEGLFIFADEETLKSHIETCEECKKEHEKFQKVSELLQEVKPLYKKKKTNIKLAIKAACALAVFCTGTMSFDILDAKYALVDTLKYGQVVSIEDMGFPVDSYGLLMLE